LIKPVPTLTCRNDISGAAIQSSGFRFGLHVSDADFALAIQLPSLINHARIRVNSDYRAASERKSTRQCSGSGPKIDNGMTGESNIELGKPIKNRFRKSGPKSAVIFCRFAKISARYRHDALFLCNANSRIFKRSTNVAFLKLATHFTSSHRR
jgi:hypothetical protein